MIALAFIAGCILSPLALVLASQILSARQDARDAARPSFLTYGDEP